MNPTLATLFAVATLLIDVFAILWAVYRGHGVERTIAWIFAIIALPVVGALAYFAFANPSVGRATRRKLLSAAAARRSLEHSLGGDDLLPPEDGSLSALTTCLTGLAPTRGNTASLLARDDQAFERIEGALRAARRRIWAEYYVVKNDATGRRFLEILADKAREGVEVRFIHDALGSMRIDTASLKAIRDAGGQTVEFLPMNPLRRRWAVHLRNHRKLVLVDDETAFTGGMNIGDEYSGRSRRRGAQHFRDTHLELRGPAVASLAQVFAEDWAFATEETLELSVDVRRTEGGTAVVAAVPSGPDQRYNASGALYFAAITGARERVFLTSPYFIPDPALETALVTAALRGVDVRVLIPDECDVRLVGAAARAHSRGLLDSGVRFFRYKTSMLHAKTLLVDECICIVGSANTDVRSFRLNFELGALMRDETLARALEERFLADLEESAEWTEEDASRVGFARRLADGAAKLLSPFL